VIENQGLDMKPLLPKEDCLPSLNHHSWILVQFLSEVLLLQLLVLLSLVLKANE